MKFTSRLIVIIFLSGAISFCLLVTGLAAAVSSEKIPFLFNCAIWVWVFPLISYMFLLKITVTPDKIIAKRWGKIKWEIEKADIHKMEYFGCGFRELLLGASSASLVYVTPTTEVRQQFHEAGKLQKGVKFFYFGASERQAKKMKTMGYNIIKL